MGLCPNQGKFKINLLREKAEVENTAIIALTESHLNSGYLEGEIHMKGFGSFRADRVNGVKNGGVITYIRDDILTGASCIVSDSIGNIEFLVLKIESLDALVIVIYRPPLAKTIDFKLAMEKISVTIRSDLQPLPRIIFTGDLNFPSVDWISQTINSCTTETREQATVLLEFFQEFFLEQQVHEATRERNILDIFATNDHELVSQILVEDNDRKFSDHKSIIIKTNLIREASLEHSKSYNSDLEALNFYSDTIDWSSLKSELGNIDWKVDLERGDVNNKYAIFLTHLTEICVKYVPLKKSKTKASLIPRDRKNLMRKRKKLRSNLLSTRNSSRLASIERSLSEIEQQLISSHEEELHRDEMRVINKMRKNPKPNPKPFFNFARSKSQVKSPIGPLIIDGNAVTDPVETAEAFKTHFESVYCPPIEGNFDVKHLLTIPGPRGLEDIEFNEEDVKNAIHEIPPNSSAGSDGISPILLRNCSDELKSPIYLLWRQSLDSGKLPIDFKKSTVIPIHKKGSRAAVENYRPISLTSHICKVFERIVVKELTKYLNSAKLFNDGQHGFRKGRSCVSQLLEHHQRILEALESDKAVDVVYLDFAKAFDRVDHTILLTKLKSMGISGKVLCWIHDFLTGRKHVVRVDGQLSSEGNVESGVPQGSSLGPLLFLILIADIDDCLEFASATSFADDTRILAEITRESNCGDMQDDLIRIYNWANDNNMKFNNTKFELMSFSGKSRNLHKPTQHGFTYPCYYTEDGTLIQSVTSVRDLGVEMQCCASFDKQVNLAIKKGTQIAGWALRVFRSREKFVLLTLFKAMVLPHLEYCSQVWSPVLSGQIQKLEAVLRSFTAKINGLHSLTYWERLKALNIYSLQRRRERYLIIYIYKIIVGAVKNLSSPKFKIKTHCSPRRGRLCIIPPLIPGANKKVKSKIEASLPVQAPRLFNALPSEIRNFEGSVNSFKGKLDKFLSKIPDQPPLRGYTQQAASNSLIDQLAVLRVGGVFYN